MKHKATLLVLSLGLWAVTAGAQTPATGTESNGYRRFLLYPHLEKGFKAMAQGDRSRALAEFEQARQLAPDNPMVAIHLAEAYRRFGEPARAEAILRALRGRTPDAAQLPLVPVALSAQEPQATPVPKLKPHVIAAAPVLAMGRSRKRGPARAQGRLRKVDTAYALADRAYRASARGDHGEAVRAARHAVQLAPGNLAYRSLLVYELTQTRQFEAADVVASQIAPHAPAAAGEAELAERHQRVRQQLAFEHFERARQAQAAGQLEAATVSARQAVAYGPDLLPYRLQWIGLLLGAQQWAEAEQAVTESIHVLGPQPALLMLRAHAVQRSSEGADVAAPSHNAPRRQADLGPLPRVVCVSQGHSPWCDVLPAEQPPDPAYALAEEAYNAFAAHQHTLAVSKAREALQHAPGHLPYHALLVQALLASGDLAQTEQEASDFLAAAGDDGAMLALRSQVRQRLGKTELAALDAKTALHGQQLAFQSEIDLLLQLQRQVQARERFATAQRSGALVALSEVDQAYLAVRVGDDAAALDAFDRAASQQTLPPGALQDAAYAAARLGRNAASVAYFKQALDAADAGQLSLTPQQRFNIRRSVADQTRSVGVSGAVTYRGMAASGLSRTPGVSNDTAQVGVETYWRPLGYGDGRLLELYGGLSGTLYSEIGLVTGAPSLQGALGARVKPLADTNLVLALERRVKVGAQTEDDWLARVGYSWDRGLDLRVDQPDWWTAQIYAEAGRFVERKQNYTTFEGQAGRSFRLDQTSPRLVVFPHVVLGADHNTGYEAGSENAVGAGVGVSLRYWFNEDKYTAPRSYWDASLQYRSHLSGDERAKGTFFRFTLSF